MLVNREVILAKVEGAYGTDSVPVEGTDAMLVENIGWSNEGLRMNERPAVRANIGMLQNVFGGRLITMTFDAELKGSGTAVDAPPEIGPLLRACGFGETINAASNVEYAPVSTGHESATIYYFQDGIRYILTGCRGNVTFNLETGAIGKASFSLTGHIASITDVALASPTYGTHVPVPLINVPFTIGAYAAVINALTWDMSNTIAMPPDISATDGYAEIQLTQRDPNGSYDPEAELIATDDPHGDLTSDTAQAITTGVIGATAFNRYQVDMPAVYYRDISPGDRDGIRTYDLPFGMAESTGDDEVTITFT